ncbi:MAG TPA: hypothetical protein VKB63_11475 [Gemmatimonadales bacterium]|nr:hypothetical protein [Gemmatimonadales bacterium]
MSIRIAINLPVTDVAASTRFFTALGFSPDPRLANEHMEAIVIGDLIYVLLIEEPFFRLVARSGTMLQLQVDSRARVDELADKAFAAGALPANEANDHAPFYGRSFSDLDGQHWDVFCIDGAEADHVAGDGRGDRCSG